MDKAVIIVAGGSGTRMKAAIPKQFLILNKKPVLMHTINRFFAFDPTIRIILVLPKNNIGYWLQLCDEYYFQVPFEIAEGGETRFHSVKKGLALLNEFKGLIGVHDGVRPLVSFKTLHNCYEDEKPNHAVIPVLPSVESVRIIDGGRNYAISRNSIMLVQTPQVFHSTILNIAYNLAFNELFTDDASVVESAGFPITLVDGNKENIKITSMDDLVFAENTMFSE